jgi:hypothetical protein
MGSKGFHKLMDALAAFKEKAPDLVLSDPMIPEMLGSQLVAGEFMLLLRMALRKPVAI